ncbi:MAG: sensor histidine kinase [Burkholderiales bacterium]
MDTTSSFRARRLWRRVLAFALLIAAAAPVFAAEPVRNVLVLYSDSRLLPALAVTDVAFGTALRADFGPQIELFSEFLGLETAGTAHYEADLAEFLRKKYAGTRFDVIVAARPPALRFLLAHRDALFPGVPVVHLQVNEKDLARVTLPPDVVGVPLRLEPDKTIELALRLHPQTRRIVVITGTAVLDRGWEKLMRDALRPLAPGVDVQFWAGLPMAENLARLQALPRDSIVYLPGLRQDGEGRRFVPQEAAAMIVARSPVPVYGSASNFEPGGTAGGYVASLEDSAGHAAQAVARILRGERPESLALPAAVPNTYVLNMHQLGRFGVSPSDLPQGAVVKYLTPTLWQAYRWQIIVVIVLLIAQAALIAGLLAQRRVRRRTEAELRESEQRMSLVAAATGIGMWVEDIQRRAFWASPQHRALLGLDATEPYDFERFLRAVHAADRGAVRETIERAVAEGGEYDIRYRVPLAGGAVRWVSSRGRVEADAHGQPLRIRGATADVTARVEAQFEEQRHRNELAHLSRVAMLGQLSGSLAHELNQPLTAILSNAQAALRFLKMDAVDLDEVREILADIVADDQRAGAVIRRLRALFERGEANQEALDLNELIREILRMLHSDLLTRNVAVAVDLDPDLPTIRGDRVQLQQLLLNLMLNACEAMAATPVADRRLSIRTRPAGGREVVVTVADRGVGIASDQLDKIFEPFVTTKPLGIGLGLAIGRGIIAAHGGRLWAERNEEGGATFHFTLQADAKTAMPAAA